MKMRDDEISVVHLQIEWHRGEHDPSKSDEHEKQNEAGNEKKRNAQPRPSRPKRYDPAKNLGATRDGNHHARRAEEAAPEQWDWRRKHVMYPQTEADESRRDEREHHHRVTENSPA